MPISQDKSAGPAQIMQFLGLTIDTKEIVIRIPQDKRDELLLAIWKAIRNRKASNLQLQSLAGKLNFDL